MRSSQPRRASALAILGLLLAACGSAEPEAAADAGASSFALLTERIFRGTCADCHSSGSSFVEESDLVLDGPDVWSNLVGRAPANPRAREDGLQIVWPGSPERSLLLRKLDPHYGHGPRIYGAPMPLGRDPLASGQVEFVRQWIRAGAPQSGHVADPLLLEAAAPVRHAPFEELPPPARGFQLRIDPFIVLPGVEREVMVMRRLHNREDLFVSRVEVHRRPNDHHFCLYTFAPNTPAGRMPAASVLRDVRTTEGVLIDENVGIFAHYVFLADEHLDLPPGVALRLPADAAIDLNAHYVNLTSEPILGEVHVNVHTVPAGEVRTEVKGLEWGTTDITLPPGQRSTVRFRQAARETMRILMLTSHTHERGERFVIRLAGGARDGRIVYENVDWRNPVVRHFDPPLLLLPGESLDAEVVFHNEGSDTIRWGFEAADEMAVIYGYYIPGSAAPSHTPAIRQRVRARLDRLLERIR